MLDIQGLWREIRAEQSREHPDQERIDYMKQQMMVRSRNFIKRYEDQMRNR